MAERDAVPWTGQAYGLVRTGNTDPKLRRMKDWLVCGSRFMLDFLTRRSRLLLYWNHIQSTVRVLNHTVACCTTSQQKSWDDKRQTTASIISTTLGTPHQLLDDICASHLLDYWSTPLHVK
jgi:hypothetical protein